MHVAPTIVPHAFCTFHGLNLPWRCWHCKLIASHTWFIVNGQSALLPSMSWLQLASSGALIIMKGGFEL